MAKTKEETQEIEMTPKLKGVISLLLEKLPDLDGRSVIIKGGKLTIK